MKPNFSEIRDRLQFVRHASDSYDLARFPDFFVIGPQRTGTTWLYRQLSLHPEVFIPTQKELYYFSTLEFPENHPVSLPPVDRELGWYLDCFDVPDDVRAQRQQQAQEMFGRDFTPKYFGEATATYGAALRGEIIDEVLLLNPDIKVITMVRDPIERAWSHAKKDLCRERSRPVADVPTEEWLEFFRRPYQVEAGHSSRFLPRWQERIPEQNLFIGRFLDVAGDPFALLRRVYELIGLDCDERFFPETASERINPTEGSDIPPHLLDELESLFGEERELQRQRGMI